MMSIILARSAILTYMSKSGKDFGTPCRYLADCLFLHMSINIRLQEIEYYVHKMMQTEGVFMAFYIKANIIVNTRISFP